MKDLWCQINILLLNMLRVFNTPSFMFKIPGFLSLNCQIPGFS